MCQYVLLLFINKRIPVKKKLQHILTVIWITFKQISLTINAKNVMTVSFILQRLNNKNQTKPIKALPKNSYFCMNIGICTIFFKVIILFCFGIKYMKSNQRSVHE